jgi:hypothetical protein
MRNAHNLPPEPEPWQVFTDAPEGPVWAWGDVPADELESELEAAPTSHEPDDRDAFDDFEEGDHLDDRDREPRIADAATWVARGIVVLTIGLLAVVGGLFLGMSVSDPTTSATPTPSTPVTSSTAVEETAEPLVETETQAPPLRVSAAVPDGAAGTTRAGGSTAPVASQTPATAAPSPTSSSTPRGKGTNSAKPRPTKSN